MRSSGYKELEPSTRGDSGAYQPGGVRNLQVRSIVELAIETAMRRSELLSLRWQDVHLNDRYVRLRDTKNGDARDVPLTRRTVHVLEALPREQDGPVFPTTADPGSSPRVSGSPRRWQGRPAKNAPAGAHVAWGWP